MKKIINIFITLSFCTIALLTNAQKKGFWDKLEEGWHKTALTTKAETIETICAKVKERKGVCDANPETVAMISEALKRCGITEAVIPMEIDDLLKTSVTAFPELDPIQFLILGRAPSNMQDLQHAAEVRRGFLYHEIGHLHYGDKTLRTEIKKSLYKYGAVAISFAVGLAATKLSDDMMYKWLIGGLAAICSQLPAWICEKAGTHTREYRADGYAIEQLLAQGYTNEAFAMLITFLGLHNTNSPRNFISNFLTSTHPRDLDRAKRILAILKTHGLQIIPLPEDISDTIKNYGPGLIKKYCPEYLPNN